MKLWVGITDKRWFDHLATIAPDECNFWQPGATRAFRVLSPGEPFLFKLHSPLNFVVGGGFFVSHGVLPISAVWDAFGEKNGASGITELRRLIQRYWQRKSGTVFDPTIGCIVIDRPFFLPRSDWIPVPKDWSPNLVQGKTYDTNSEMGSQLWRDVQLRLQGGTGILRESNVAYEAESTPRFGSEYLTRARLGQGAFRVLVTEAYTRRCAVTGERTLPVLQAAHIRPFAQHGPNSVSNGLCLRSDIHILYDNGLLTVTPDYQVRVSGKIRSLYENGREYYRMSGLPLQVLPRGPEDQPSREFLEWHNDTVFSP